MLQNFGAESPYNPISSLSTLYS